MRLGQHFLINKDKIKEIINALDLKSGDTIIEIGPGHGELTLELRIKNAELRIIAIEKDRKLAEDLRLKIKDLRLGKKVEIIEGDILKILSAIIHNSKFIIQNYKIVGNIPYYITGKLLRIIGELKHKPSLIVLTVQKEVAERVAAEPPKMNLLAASVQFWAEPEIVGYISKKDFQPMPKVDSAIINLTPKTPNLTPKTYYPFIKILFRQPRKTILNNLKSQISNLKNKEEIIKKLKKLNIDPNHRPQDLNLEQIRSLSLYLKF